MIYATSEIIWKLGLCYYTHNMYVYIYIQYNIYICIIPFVEAVEHVISFLLSDTIVAEG